MTDVLNEAPAAPEFSGKIINGKAVSARIRTVVREQALAFEEKSGRKPALAVVIAGDDPASKIYVRNKKNACAEVGFASLEFALPADVSEEELLSLIGGLNADANIDGILVQLPLPRGIDEKKIINAISPEKDVDCFHPVNVGRLCCGDPGFLPCTPAGIMELIAATGTSVRGKNCLVIGRSNIVGKPVSMLLLAADGTVTTAHSKTVGLKEIARNADILVAAVGRAKMIDASFIKPGAVVIDVGMNRDENGKLCGDCDFESVFPVCGAITPVPGGVGPMTITMLLRNTLYAAESIFEKKKAGGE
ncbi:MAG: bifunctional methylenetetrahydrofolate dehydrogenase/methenyltetrahydrofolate cyclohydrolase FolD [Clostridia bacterium]|nr:bifunctional methylenetetrahydrofolate dehydrogenase/methenyltetrahydrofolate cyclohydrolase FolD [Clostridia bacterium]